MKKNLPYLGIDFGTSNTSLAYVVQDARDPTPRFPTPHEIKVPIDAEGVLASTRIPTAASFEGAGKKKRPSRLLGWQVWQRFMRPNRKKAALLRKGQDLFLSVKSDLGSYRVYPHATSDEFNMPEKVASAIIRALTDAAQDKLKNADLFACKVVVTVPASLNAEARKQTIDATASAGFKRDNIELVDEPIAALLDLLNSPQSSTILEPNKLVKMLVFDYGGGTLDLSLVRCTIDTTTHSGLLAENLAISNYRRNGGNDIDRMVMEDVVWPQVLERLGCDRSDLPIHIQQRIEDSLTWTVARNLKEGICAKVERALREGSSWSDLARHPEMFTTPISMEFTDDDLPAAIKTARLKITSKDFDSVMAPFLRIPVGDREDWPLKFRHSLLLPVFEILDQVGMSPLELDYLVLHGGSCRNPWVRDLLKEGLAASGTLFGDLQVIETPDLDTSVARGAALACYWKQCREEEIIPPITGEDFGILTLNEQPVRLLAAGEHLPFPKTGVKTVETEFFIPQAALKQLRVPFYTGSRNKISGVVTVDLPPGTPKGCPVHIKFKIDRDKLLHWWYSVGSGADKPATGLQDPWTARELSSEQRRLQAIRQEMHRRLQEGEPIPASMEIDEIYALYRADDLSEAELLALEFVDRHGLTHDASNALSLIYGTAGEQKKELRYARETVRLNPKNPVFVGNLGWSLANAGHLDEAIATLRSALSLDENLGYVYHKLGDIYRKKGDEVAALREYQQAIRCYEKASDDHPSKLFALRQLYHEIGEYDKSREFQSRIAEVHLNERFQGDHRQTIAGPDSGF